ncbi:MAG: TRAP transporter small permease [Flavobacteriaceae bacterium]
MKNKVDRILEYLLVALFSIMLFSVLWQVFSRFFLKSPSTLTDEISSYGLIWVGLLGAAYATGKKLHLAIDLFPKKLVARRAVFLDGFVYVAVAFFSIMVMVIGGGRLCWITFALGQKSAALEIPLGFVYLVVPLSGLLILYYCILHFELLRKQKKD